MEKKPSALRLRTNYFLTQNKDGVNFYTVGQMAEKLRKFRTEKEKEEEDRTSLLEKKVEHLEREMKTLKKELLEMKKKNKEDTPSGTGKADLSFPAFRQFCLKYAEAGAYFSNVNYRKWKSSGGKMIFSFEDHLKATESSTSYNSQENSWPRGFDNSAYNYYPGNRRRR